MRISPEVLKTLSTYRLKNKMAEINCTPEDEAEICHYILANDELFQNYTPHLADLINLYQLFSNNKADLSLEEKFYQKFFSSEKSIRKFFSNYYDVSQVYETFLNKTDLSLERKSLRCVDFLDQLKSSPTFKQMEMIKYRYLPDLINLDTAMQEKILSWAMQTNLIQSNIEKDKILENLLEVQREAEEKQREMQREAEEKQHKLDLENAVNQIREKISKRGYYFQTELHRIVGSVDPRKEDIQKALTLIKNGASLEERDQFGATPLINAAIAGNMMMTLMLLSRGAKVSRKDKDGYTAKLYKLNYL